MKYKKTINCLSCEIKSDVIVKQTNYDNEELEILYCPMCSALLSDMDEDTEDD